MYDDFSADYDRFVNWQERLAVELPFIVERMSARPSGSPSLRVLDAACGTGMHAIALAQKGYMVVGADLSTGMIERAQANASAVGADVRFVAAGFGELSTRVGTGFDAVLCLGNSLPHVLTAVDLAAALADFAVCLRPGGMLLIQNRNFDAVLDRRERWMLPQSYREGEAEWLFLRFYDFEADGTLRFNVVTLQRDGQKDWSQRVAITRLWPLRQRDLTMALASAGFGEIACWGDMQGNPFDLTASGNLVVGARLIQGT